MPGQDNVPLRRRVTAAKAAETKMKQSLNRTNSAKPSEVACAGDSREPAKSLFCSAIAAQGAHLEEVQHCCLGLRA